MLTRKRLGMTQAELAAALGVHVMTIWKWERNQHPIPEVAVLALTALKPKRKGGKRAK
jgi:transcriptional regulator with XRE-family HTH domain